MEAYLVPGEVPSVVPDSVLHIFSHLHPQRTMLTIMMTTFIPSFAFHCQKDVSFNSLEKLKSHLMFKTL